MSHNHDEEVEECAEERLSWQGSHYVWGEQLFIPKIAEEFESELSDGFNAVTIKINGKTDSDLNWKTAENNAKLAAERGIKILWELDLGLYESLREPLTNEAQYRSLCLALDHFRQNLWKSFHANTLGLCLYKGSSEFSACFQWDREQLENLRGWLTDHFQSNQELSQEIEAEVNISEILPSKLASIPKGKTLLEVFCRNACVSYLDLLIGSLPDAAAAFVFLDTFSLVNPIEYANTINTELFERFFVGVSHPLFFHQQLGWRYGTSSGYLSKQLEIIPSLKEVNLGICWPSLDVVKPSLYAPFNEMFRELKERGKDFRIIPESRLTADWDGLDYLIVNPLTLSQQGKRKLLGFCAAGGTVLTIGNTPLGLPQEELYQI